MYELYSCSRCKVYELIFLLCFTVCCSVLCSLKNAPQILLKLQLLLMKVCGLFTFVSRQVRNTRMDGWMDGWSQQTDENMGFDDVRFPKIKVQNEEHLSW